MAEVIGREQRTIRRALDEEQVRQRTARVARSYENQRDVQNAFKTFKDYAAPRVRRALDPDYENDELEGEEKLSIEAARALNDELEHRRKLKSSSVAAIKAERRLAMDEAANGYAYEVAEVELVRDDEKLEIVYLHADTGEEVDRRAMSGEERQTELSGTNGSGKGRKGKSSSPAAVH